MRPHNMSLGAVDQTEFGRLVEQYRRELQVHCYRLTGSVHDAEDMVQEAFLKAWRNRETLQEPSALRAWLYKIATNVCLDALKKLHKRFVPNTFGSASTLTDPIAADVNEPVWLEPYPDDLLPAEDQDPETRLMTREDIALAFIAALHLLPPRQRATLILGEVMDLQASEIAGLLDTTVSSVKSALHRARSTLAARGYAPTDVSDRMLDSAARARLEDYVRAWEGADVSTLISLLRDDATFSMPPIPSWYQGKDTIRGLVTRTVFGGQAALRWRLLPTHANCQPAFGLYRRVDAGSLYSAYGIQVLTMCGGFIADITTFRNDSLFRYFGLPQTITRSVLIQP